MANYISLSYFLDKDTPTYGGGKGISIFPEKSISKGDSANTKRIEFNNHSGTHIDFPNHFLINGLTSDSYPASFWIFNRPFLFCKNIEKGSIISLTKEELSIIPKDVDFLIYKTGFWKYRSGEQYWNNNPGFAPETADLLRSYFPFLRVLGMDIISLTGFQNRELGRLAHKNFLGGERPILLVEDMDLSNLNKQPNSLVCAPLMIRGIDGTPVNIIAEI